MCFCSGTLSVDVKFSNFLALEILLSCTDQRPSTGKNEESYTDQPFNEKAFYSLV